MSNTGDPAREAGSPLWWREFHTSLRLRLSPENLARQAVRELAPGPCDLLAIGKAALPLLRGMRAGCGTAGRSLLVLPAACAKNASRGTAGNLDTIKSRDQYDSFANNELCEKATPHLQDMHLLSSSLRGLPTKQSTGLPSDSCASLRPAAAAMANSRQGHVELLPAEHPLPGDGSFAAGARVAAWVTSGCGGNTLLAGISGGASALLAMPAAGLDAPTKTECHRALIASGLDIGQINTVRRHLSGVKGGNLLRLAATRYERVELLAISDVPGDAVHEIGSGPFSPDPTTFAEALAIARAIPGFPAAALRHLEKGCAGEIPETLKPGEIPADRFSARVLAGSGHARDAAIALLGEAGFDARPLPFDLSGSPANWVERFLAWRTSLPLSCPTWWVASGETEVAIPPGTVTGRGGRATSLVLRLGLALHAENAEADLAVIATDGADGNSGSGGGFLAPDALRNDAGRQAGREALGRHAAAELLEGLDSLFPGSPGETNFGDLLLFRFRT